MEKKTEYLKNQKLEKQLLNLRTVYDYTEWKKCGNDKKIVTFWINEAQKLKKYKKSFDRKNYQVNKKLGRSNEP